MREYFLVSRYYNNKRSERLWKEIDRETPSVRERLLMWGRRDSEDEKLRDSMSVCERKEKEWKALRVWVYHREEKILIPSDSDGLWKRERESEKERDNDRLWECVCVCERERRTDKEEIREKEREIETDRETLRERVRLIDWGRTRRERETDRLWVCVCV